MSKLTKKQRKEKSRKLFKKAVRKIMRRNKKTKKNYGGVERQSRRKGRTPPPIPPRKLKRSRSRRSRRRRRRPPPIPFRMPPTPHTPKAPMGFSPHPLEIYNVRTPTPTPSPEIKLVAIKPYRSSNKVKDKTRKWQLNLNDLDQLNPDKQFRKKRGNKMQEPE